MAYTPTNWADGQAPYINAENLNKIENALAALSGFSQTTFTEAAGVSTYGSNFVLKIGKLVVGAAFMYTTQNKPTGAVYLSVADDNFKPAANTKAAYVCYHLQGKTFDMTMADWFAIDANGNVKMTSASGTMPANTTIGVLFIYPTA